MSQVLNALYFTFILCPILVAFFLTFASFCRIMEGYVSVSQI